MVEGGGHRTRLKDQTINCCVLGVPPAPVYKGARGGGAAGQEEARQEESYSHRAAAIANMIRTDLSIATGEKVSS